MSATRTIDQLSPNPGLIPAALVEVSQATVSYKSTVQEILDLVTVVNVGAGVDIFRDRTTNAFNLKTLIAGTNITFVDSGDDITINSELDGITSINADTTPAQVIAGTTNQINVVDAGATHTIQISAGYVGQTSITTLGTITTGVWNATNILKEKIQNVALTEIDVQTVTNKTLDSFTNMNHADTEHLEAQNETGVLITKGSVVHISGYDNPSDLPSIVLADASSPATMPAVGIATQDIADGTSGDITLDGILIGVVTTGFTPGNPIYVSTTAGLFTETKPTGTAEVQNIGTILKAAGAGAGRIKVTSIDRSNDLPNIADTNFWVGNASAVPTAVVMSGDATMDNLGAVTIASGSITNAMLAGGVYAAITGLGAQTQTLDMNSQNIISVGILAVNATAQPADRGSLQITGLDGSGNATHISGLYNVGGAINTHASATTFRGNDFNTNTLNGTSTFTTAATVRIAGAPVAGTATITNAYALWIDSGNSRFDGQILGGNGSAGAPSYAFNSRLNLGFFYDSADTIGVSMAGTQHFNFGASGFYGENAAGPFIWNRAATATNGTLLPNRADGNTGIGWAGVDNLSFITGGIEGLRVDASQNVLIGANLGSGVAAFTFNSNNNTDHFRLNNGRNAGAAINEFQFRRSRGSVASPTDISNNDILGEFDWYAYDSGYVQVGRMRVEGSNVGGGTTSGLMRISLADSSGVMQIGLDILPAGLRLLNGKNIEVGTGTGTEIGTASSQKLGKWGATPVVQPAHIIDADGTLADITTKFNTLLAQHATTGDQAAS